MSITSCSSLKIPWIFSASHFPLLTHKSLTQRFGPEILHRGFLFHSLHGIQLQFQTETFFPLSIIQLLLVLINLRTSVKPFQNHEFPFFYCASHRGFFWANLALIILKHIILSLRRYLSNTF